MATFFRIIPGDEHGLQFVRNPLTIEQNFGAGLQRYA